MSVLLRPHRVIWQPFEGFQTRVLQASEDDLLIGGAKGSGKSDLLVAKHLQQVHRPRYKGLVLRQRWDELREMLDRAHRIYGKLTPKPAWNGSDMRFRWPNGATVEFGYCRDKSDVARYQGNEPTSIHFDELGNVADPEVIPLLIAEMRSPDPTLRRQFIGSANPGKAGHINMVRRYVKPTQYGARLHWEKDEDGTYLSRRFIPGRVTDNPIYANDPKYMAQLRKLPDRLRRQLLDGDWDAAEGLALDELDARHWLPAFAVPDHWPLFGAFDWGFSHPWAFGLFTVTEDREVILLDSVHGRRMKDPEIVERIMETCPLVRRCSYIVAGTDVFTGRGTKADDTPSCAERFAERGLVLTPANTARVAGLNNLRYWLGWRGVGEDGADLRQPRLRFCDTRGNRITFACLESMTTDPDNPEDALKRDANEDGEGGDDPYDMVRYGMASRPFAADDLLPQRDVRAFDPAVLAYEADVQRRHTSVPLHERRTQSTIIPL